MKELPKVSPPASLRVVLTIISDAFCCPVGLRMERANPLPRRELFDERRGYYFDPATELELANEVKEELDKYLIKSMSDE